jgi:hypothetical protein
VRKTLLLGTTILVLSIGCSTSPTAPSLTTASPAPTFAVPPTPPTSTAVARMFVYASPLSLPNLMWYTPRSRFVLREDGTFALEYPHSTYQGRYTQSGNAIMFDWDGWSVAGSWGAVGTLADGRLSVRFNLIMQLSDFEDAVYSSEP